MKYPNGSESVLSCGPWAQLIGVKNCMCSDGKARTVSRMAEADTFFSMPGSVKVRGKSVRGFVSCDDQGYTFHAYKYRKNGNLLP
jgi:hypothetical protein